jgi:hypothetical protein
MKRFDPIIKYDDRNVIVSKIADNIKDHIEIAPAIRLCLDPLHGFREQLVLCIPATTDLDGIYKRIADALYLIIFKHYLDADPLSSHFGISNKVIEGTANSLLFRELEKFLINASERPDIAGRFLKGLSLSQEIPRKFESNLYLAETLKKGLQINTGLRVLTKGKQVMPFRIFIPMQTGNSLIFTVLKNIEQMMLHTYSHLDEKNEKQLILTENLIFKDLELILKRAKEKKNTRRKILSDLQAIYDIKPSALNIQGIHARDTYYDRLNQDDKVQSVMHSDQSYSLYSSFLNNQGEESIGNFPETVGVETQFLNPAVLEREDKAAFTIDLTKFGTIRALEKSESGINVIPEKEWYFNTRAGLKLTHYQSTSETIALSSSARQTGISQGDNSESSNPTAKGGIGQDHCLSPLPKDFHYSFRPLIRRPFKVVANSFSNREYANHPLGKQYLLYPYHSDYEKLAKTLDTDQKLLHPKVEDFSKRRFARRNQVTHPLNLNPPKNLGRRHSDKKPE